MIDINYTNVWGQKNLFTEKARDLWMSKLFQEPIHDIVKTFDFTQWVDSWDKESQEQKSKHKRRALGLPKFMMYSAHDTTVANVWDFLKPTDFEYSVIPYASFVQIKLW